MGRFENLEISIKPKKKDIKYEWGYDEVYYIKLAKDAQINGDFEAALRYYSRALSYKKDIEEAWVGQVICLIDLGEFDEAVVWADRGIEVIGNSPELLAVKAMALGRNGEIERALGYSEQAIKKKGDSPILWLSRGDIIIAEDFRNAEFCFRKAIECDKNDALIHLRISISLLSVQEFPSAIVHLKKAMILNPKSPFIPFLIGKAYNAIGIIKNAKNYYERSLKIRPDFKECILAYKKTLHQSIFNRILSWFKCTFFRSKEVYYGKN